MRKILAVLILGCAAVCGAQVIGLTPTPQAVYFWNTATSNWAPCPNTSTAEPFASTPQAFVQEGFNTGLGQWTPSTSCPGGLNTGLTSFQGRTDAAAILLLSDVNVKLLTATNCNVIGLYVYSPVTNSCILISSGTSGVSAINGVPGSFTFTGSGVSCTSTTCTFSAGGGTVTTFSAGTLSPLFTTSVANATTTPALTFTASTAAQNAVLAGPASGGTGAYSFRALVAADIPAVSPSGSAGGALAGTYPNPTISGLGSTANVFTLTDGTGKLQAATNSYIDSDGFLNLNYPGINIVTSSVGSGGQLPGIYMQNLGCPGSPAEVGAIVDLDTGNFENLLSMGHQNECSSSGLASQPDISFITTTGSSHKAPNTSTYSVTNSQLTSNVVTLTASNSLSIGQFVMVFNLTSGTLGPLLNGGIFTVLSASSTQFTFAFTHANVGSAAESGNAEQVVDNQLDIANQTGGIINVGGLVGTPLMSFRSGLSPNGIFLPLLSGCLSADGTTHLVSGTGSACGSGGSGPTIQTNTVNNASQVLLNFTTSTANSVGLTATPVNTSGGIEKIEITGSSYTGNAATATLSTTATNLVGGVLGSAPYQNAASTTLFIASPTTTGHTFLYGWQPLGSAIAPVAIDGATYLASPPAIGGTSPAAIGGTIITANSELVAAALGTATNVSNFGSAGYISLASYWTGSAAAVDNWNWSTQLGTGSNPTSTLNFGHTGTSGISTVLMPNLTIGAIAGSAGVLTFGNATSGSIALTPPTGALGTVTLTVPDATDTLVGRGTTDTLSNKTLVAPALGTPASGIMTNVTGNATGLNSGTATNLLICSDTSASGTAQTCTTSPSFTPAANSCAIYTTTTANSGTGLTLNVNSLGAKSVAKWLGTTTLAAGDVAANSPQLACYNGTVWNLSTIGNAPSGGTVTWNGISNPTGNQSLSMGNDTTTWTFGTATGSTTPMVTFTDSASNTGTGPVLKVATAASSAGFPAQFFQRGTALLTVGATGGGTGSGFAGPLWVNATSNVQGAGLYVGASGIYGIGGSTLINSAAGNTQPLTLQNGTTPANGTSVSVAFQAINSAFSNKSVGIITGTLATDTSTSEEGTLSFSTIHLGSQVTALTLSGAGNGVTTGTITSALGNAAITSATGATGVTSVTCQTAACDVSRGSYTVVGGTATTGTIVTLLWPTTTTAWVCSVDMNGGTGFLGLGHGVATATGMTVTAGVTVVGTTFTFDYNCVP